MKICNFKVVGDKQIPIKNYDRKVTTHGKEKNVFEMVSRLSAVVKKLRVRSVLLRKICVPESLASGLLLMLERVRRALFVLLFVGGIDRSASSETCKRKEYRLTTRGELLSRNQIGE